MCAFLECAVVDTESIGASSFKQYGVSLELCCEFMFSWCLESPTGSLFSDQECFFAKIVLIDYKCYNNSHCLPCQQ